MDKSAAENGQWSSDALTNQARVLRSELKNIREKQKQLKAVMTKMVAEIKNRLDSGTKTSGVLSAQASSEYEVHSGNSYEVSDEKYSFKPISYIKSCYKNKNGTPRQANICSASRASLKLDKSVFTNPEHSVIGLQEFSHVWLLFVFHQNEGYSTGPRVAKAKVQLPRMDGGTAGVFATRSPHRPCPIGLSLSKLERIDGDTLYLSGVDIVDGTPVLDIKPYIPSYDNPNAVQWCTTVSNSSLQNSQPRHCSASNHLPKLSKGDEEPSVLSVNVASWLCTPKVLLLQVLLTDRAEKQITLFHNNLEHNEKCKYCLEFLNNPNEVRTAIEDVLREDPRSVYRRHKCTDRLYYFTLDVVHVTCWFDDTDNVVEVLRVRPEEAEC